jgi:hypothetical protein
VGFEHPDTRRRREERGSPRRRRGPSRRTSSASKHGASKRFIEEQLKERPNRFDYLFTWEQEGFKAKEATNRRSVTVQGDQVGAYQEFLYVPEKWKRDFATMRAANDLYAQIATGFYVPMILGAVVLIIIWIRRKSLDWRPVVLVSLVVAS